MKRKIAPIPYPAIVSAAHANRRGFHGEAVMRTVRRVLILLLCLLVVPHLGGFRSPEQGIAHADKGDEGGGSDSGRGADSGGRGGSDSGRGGDTGGRGGSDSGRGADSGGRGGS